jgi:hypothetical protein
MVGWMVVGLVALVFLTGAVARRRKKPPPSN